MSRFNAPGGSAGKIRPAAAAPGAPQPPRATPGYYRPVDPTRTGIVPMQNAPLNQQGGPIGGQQPNLPTMNPVMNQPTMNPAMNQAVMNPAVNQPAMNPAVNQPAMNPAMNAVMNQPAMNQPAMNQPVGNVSPPASLPRAMPSGPRDYIQVVNSAESGRGSPQKFFGGNPAQLNFNATTSNNLGGSAPGLPPVSIELQIASLDTLPVVLRDRWPPLQARRVHTVRVTVFHLHLPAGPGDLEFQDN